MGGWKRILPLDYIWFSLFEMFLALWISSCVLIWLGTSFRVLRASIIHPEAFPSPSLVSSPFVPCLCVEATVENEQSKNNQSDIEAPEQYS